MEDKELAHEIAIYAWGKNVPSEITKFEKFIKRALNYIRKKNRKIS